MFDVFSELEFGRKVASSETPEIVIFAEHLVGNLQIRRAEVFNVHVQDGFQELGDLIANRKFEIVDVKILILLLGRADLWQSDNKFRQSVGYVLEQVRKLNKKAIVLFCAIIPVPGDSVPIKRTSVYRHGYLSHLAGRVPRPEFCKPGKNLLVNGSALQEYFDAEGTLNAMGTNIVVRGLEAKIKCAGLFRKFHDLKAKLHDSGFGC